MHPPNQGALSNSTRWLYSSSQHERRKPPSARSHWKDGYCRVPPRQQWPGLWRGIPDDYFRSDPEPAVKTLSFSAASLIRGDGCRLRPPWPATFFDPAAWGGSALYLWPSTDSYSLPLCSADWICQVVLNNDKESWTRAGCIIFFLCSFNLHLINGSKFCIFFQGADQEAIRGGFLNPRKPACDLFWARSKPDAVESFFHFLPKRRIHKYVAWGVLLLFNFWTYLRYYK